MKSKGEYLRTVQTGTFDCFEIHALPLLDVLSNIIITTSNAMSRSNVHADGRFEIRKTGSIETSYPVITHDWAIRPRPEKRSSPPLSDLFPEYYEPIEPELTSSYAEPTDTTKMSLSSDIGQPEKDKEATESLESSRNGLQARKMQSHHALISPSRGFDIHNSEVSPSKHHCLISGHVFDHYRLSRLHSAFEIAGLEPPSQLSTHRQEDLKVRCMICRARIREHLWKCAIPVCVREVSGDCRNRLEGERASSAKAGWRGGS